ncbi:TSUP family transporter [Acinetobacter baumannii]
MLLLVVEGIVIGFLLGLTGAGGGILAVPALMTSQGWSVAQAAPIGLLAVALSTLIGTIEGLFKKIVRYRAAIWIALIGAPMAHIGILIANTISPIWLMLMFSLVMFTVGYRLISNRISIFITRRVRSTQVRDALSGILKLVVCLRASGLLLGF